MSVEGGRSPRLLPSPVPMDLPIVLTVALGTLFAFGLQGSGRHAPLGPNRTTQGEVDALGQRL